MYWGAGRNSSLYRCYSFISSLTAETVSCVFKCDREPYERMEYPLLSPRGRQRRRSFRGRFRGSVQSMKILDCRIFPHVPIMHVSPPMTYMHRCFFNQRSVLREYDWPMWVFKLYCTVSGRVTTQETNCTVVMTSFEPFGNRVVLYCSTVVPYDP